MTSFGVVPQGFNLKTFQTILDEIETDQRASFGAKINQQADGVLGVLNGIFANKIAEMYELAQAVIAARTLDSATGSNLDDVVAIAGVTRNPATKSTANVRLNLQAGIVLAIGRVVAIGPSGTQWLTRSEITNSDTGPDIIVAPVDASVTGPIPGNATTIDTIVTPVSGWSAKACITTVGAQPFNVGNGDSLTINTGTGNGVVNFITADFGTPGAATAAELVTKINAVASAYCTATATSDNRVRIEDKLDGSGSLVDIPFNGVTGVPLQCSGLGFEDDFMKGMNPDRSPTLLAGLAGPYNLTGGGTLTFSINGVTQTITFASNASTTARSAADQVNALNIDLKGYVANNRLLITTGGVGGANVTLEAIGGTVAAVFNFAETLVSGTSGDAIIGHDLETDSQEKTRYLDSLFLPGSGTTSAIKAAVEGVANVEQVIVLENKTDATDSNGIMPHGVHVIVSGGDDTAVANAIFSKLSAGTPTYRDPGAAGRTISVIDASGDEQLINFSRAVAVPIYVSITVSVNLATFGNGDSVAGAETIKETIKALGDTNQDIGDDIVALRYKSAPLPITGVVDVTAFAIDTINPPVNTANIAVANTSFAQFSTTRIFVTVVSA